MTTELNTFLSDLDPKLQEEEVWGQLRLALSVYLTERPPPSDLVSSVRAVVLKGDCVVTVRTHGGATAILPGGRVEKGESFSDTLRRELLNLKLASLASKCCTKCESIDLNLTERNGQTSIVGSPS